MRFHTTMAAAGIVTALATAPLAQAQSSDPAWLDNLTEQLAGEEQCFVEYFINVSEGELAGRKTFEARAQCRDGRQFDAARTEPDRQFSISLCEQVQVC